MATSATARATASHRGVGLGRRDPPRRAAAFPRSPPAARATRPRRPRTAPASRPGPSRRCAGRRGRPPTRRSRRRDRRGRGSGRARTPGRSCSDDDRPRPPRRSRHPQLRRGVPAVGRRRRARRRPRPASGPRAGRPGCARRARCAPPCRATPMSRSTTSIRPLSCRSRASAGPHRCSAAAATVPMSATVSATVFSSRSKTARWASSAARRKRLRKARPPTRPEIADAMSGRAASRSAFVAQHDAVGHPLADQRPDAGVVQRGRGPVGELVGVEERPARVAGQRRRGEQQRREDDQRRWRGTGGHLAPWRGESTPAVSGSRRAGCATAR